MPFNSVISREQRERHRETRAMQVPCSFLWHRGAKQFIPLPPMTISLLVAAFSTATLAAFICK